MAVTTSEMLDKGSKSFEKAWDEAPKEFEPCKTCKTPGYCKGHECQQKQAASMKKLEG